MEKSEYSWSVPIDPAFLGNFQVKMYKENGGHQDFKTIHTEIKVVDSTTFLVFSEDKARASAGYQIKNHSRFPITVFQKGFEHLSYKIEPKSITPFVFDDPQIKNPKVFFFLLSYVSFFYERSFYYLLDPTRSMKEQSRSTKSKSKTGFVFFSFSLISPGRKYSRLKIKHKLIDFEVEIKRDQRILNISEVKEQDEDEQKSTISVIPHHTLSSFSHLF